MSGAIATNVNAGRIEESHHTRLRALAARMRVLRTRCEHAQDRRAVFTDVYEIMTKDIDRHLESMALFDPGWIVSLAEVFADRYFAAVEADDAGRSPGPAWQAVFDAMRSGSSVLEDIVFPMTAHIVHDLPLALIDCGFDGPGAAARLHDYDRVNVVMQRSLHEIRRRITRRYSPGLRFLDRMESRYDLMLNSYGIRMSRGQAWYDALRLRDAACAEDAKQSLEVGPITLVDTVMCSPDTPAGMVFASFRRVAAMFRRWP